MTELAKKHTQGNSMKRGELNSEYPSFIKKETNSTQKEDISQTKYSHGSSKSIPSIKDYPSSKPPNRPLKIDPITVPNILKHENKS